MRNLLFLIDNLASADPSFGEEFYSWMFFFDEIDLIIALLIKGIWINRKHMQRLSNNCSGQG